MNPVSWSCARLALIGDGVNEGTMRIPLFVESLTRELRQATVKRLRLLLACRTASRAFLAGASKHDISPIIVQGCGGKET